MHCVVNRRVVDIKSEMKETKGVMDGVAENAGYNTEAVSQLIQAKHFDGVGTKLSRAREIMEGMTAGDPPGLTTSLASMIGSPFGAVTGIEPAEDKTRLSQVGPGRYQGAAVGSAQAVVEHARRASLGNKTVAPLPKPQKKKKQRQAESSDSDDYF